jgi:iron complex outermembrane receptor protein
MSKGYLAGASALALALACSSARAQAPVAAAAEGAATAAASAAPVATSAAQGEDSSGTALKEVVVTATKRATSLERTPIAISAFSQAALDENKVHDVTDLARFVPSLAYTQQGDQSAILLTMRGIGNDSAYTEVADPEVAIYVDGIYSPRAQGASVLLYDMERVEVDRGPQGTLFGRNATVGAINLITARPKLDEFSGSAEAIVGDYNRFGSRFALNIPVTDTFAIRVAFVSEQHDGYVDYQAPPNVPGINPSAYVTDGKKYYAADQKSGRVSLLWKPDDKFTWNLNGEYYVDNGAPVLNLMQDPRPGEKLWSAQIDTAPEQDRYSGSIRSEMDYNFNADIAASYIAGWGKIGGSTDVDADAGTEPPTSDTLPNAGFEENHTVWSSYESWSQELQLKSPGHHVIDWIVGAYYSHETNRIRFDIDERNGYRDGTFNWAGSFIQADRMIQSKAVFTQETWNINDRLRLTGGIRYTNDEKEDIGGRNVEAGACPTGDDCSSGIFGQYPGDTAAQLVAALPGYNISNNDTRGSWSKLTWLARVDGDIIPKQLLGYASVSTGFKSGNIEDGGLLAGPETLTNYETGLKWRLFDNRINLNMAAYYEDFKGYQVNQAVTDRDAAGNIISTQLVTQNAKGAEVYGFEAELEGNITADDRVQFSFSALHTKLESLLSIDSRLYSGNDLSHEQQLDGNELAHAPAASGTISYEHSFHLGDRGTVTPRATTHFETSSWLSFFDAGPHDRQNAYTRTDLSLRYKPVAGRWLVEGFVQNVENNNIKTSAGTYGAPSNPVWTSVYQPPRTFGARFSVDF